MPALTTIDEFQFNSHLLLKSIISDEPSWISKNTAILIIHGIGNELPMETLDQFGRGLIAEYKKVFAEDLKLRHEIVPKPDDNGKTWFDNVLRIKKGNSQYFIDLYEYYWANYTEDKASWNDLNKWFEGVVKGANSFYKRNAQLGKQYKDRSIFFDTRTGDFKIGTYRFFMTTVSQIFFIVNSLYKALIWIVSHIPFIGSIAGSIMDSYANSLAHNLTNVLGDVVVYNVIDPKSKFYCIRSPIMDGALKAVQYLLEKTNNKNHKKQEINLNELKKKYNADKNTKEYDNEATQLELTYPSVIIAGHSLGSQVAYDAINKVNLMINEDRIVTYDTKGNCIFNKNINIKQQLNGFITFGCPLDKIVFFLRENVPDQQYLRQQFLDNYHGFKQRNLNGYFNNTSINKSYVKADCGLEKFLEEIQWRNYYDDKDYVSGGLDYYDKLININCQFEAGKLSFTHSYYWDCSKFYIDIINNYLS